MQNIAGFAAGRRRLGKTQETMSRLYVVESRFTITGGLADHRLRMASSNIGNVATTLASKLGVSGGGSFAAPALPDTDAWLTACAADLQNAKGRVFVVCGSQQPTAVQQLVAQINDALGARGTVYEPRFIPKVSAASISDLATQITAGAIKTLIVLGGNPAFNAPAELGFADTKDNPSILNKVPQVIRHGLYVDETSATSTIHLPAAHFLEYWGDNISYGTTTYLCQQPMILPLYNGISELDFLAALAGLPKAKGPEFVQATFAALTGTPASSGSVFDAAWRQFVHDGYYQGGLSLPMAVDNLQGFMAQSAAGSAAVPGQGSQQAPGKPLGDGEYELVFTLGLIDDGRYANNGWLQELPDPVSRLTWDNVLYMSPKTADKLGIKISTSNDNFSDLPNTDVNPRKTPIGIIPHVDMLTAFPMVEITTAEGRTLQLPVMIAPGQADSTLSIALGWGPHRAAPDQG